MLAAVSKYQMPAVKILLIVLAWIALIAAPAALAQGAVEARHGMVVAQEARAARIGVAVLERGGNAVDAAVATGFALAVTYPRAGNIGGGGYMVIHFSSRQKGPRDVAIDYRETAPKAATRDMFLDEKGNADPRKSRDSALAIGVPGTVAGLALAHRRFGSGRLTLAELMEPAIKLAREGFVIEDDLADLLPRATARLARWPASLKVFFRNGKALARRRHARATRPRRHAGGDRRSTGPAPSTKVRSPRRSRRLCKSPAGS